MNLGLTSNSLVRHRNKKVDFYSLLFPGKSTFTLHDEVGYHRSLTLELQRGRMYLAELSAQLVNAFMR